MNKCKYFLSGLCGILLCSAPTYGQTVASPGPVTNTPTTTTTTGNTMGSLTTTTGSGLNTGGGRLGAGGNNQGLNFQEGFQGTPIEPLMKTIGGTTIPPSNLSTSNPFRDSYVNPYTAGLPIGMSPQAFGSPTFATVTTPGGQGGRGQQTGAAGFQGGAGGQNTTSTGFSTIGKLRTTPYATYPGYGVPTIQHTATELVPKIREVLVDNAFVPSAKSIQITMNGSIVVLRGTVSHPREKRMAANVVRLTPGVRGVQNELTIVAP